MAGNIWTIYRFGLSGWEVGGGVRGQKGAWLTDTNIPGSTIPSYLVADATVAYVQRQYEVRLNVTNLADKVYYIGGYNNSPESRACRVTRAAPRSRFVICFLYMLLRSYRVSSPQTRLPSFVPESTAAAGSMAT